MTTVPDCLNSWEAGELWHFEDGEILNSTSEQIQYGRHVSNFTLRKLMNRSSRKFYHRSICGQGRTMKFYKSSAFGCGSRNFWSILLYCEMENFSTIWPISPEKLMGSLWILYHKYNFKQRFPVKFWKSSAYAVWTRSQGRPHDFLQGGCKAGDHSSNIFLLCVDAVLYTRSHCNWDGGGTSAGF